MYREIQKVKDSGEKYDTVSLLSIAVKDISQIKRIQELFFNSQEVQILHFDKSSTKYLKPHITLNIPLNGEDIQLELIENKSRNTQEMPFRQKNRFLIINLFISNIISMLASEYFSIFFV